MMAVGPAMLAAQAASGVFGAVQSISEGNAAAANSRFQAQVLRNEASVAENNALRAEADAERTYADASMRGFAAQLETRDSDEDALREIGTELRRRAASGLTGPTPAAVIAEMTRLAARDRERIARQGQEEAEAIRERGYSFEVEAADLRFGATTRRDDAIMSERNAGTQQLSGYLGGAGSLLSAGAKMGGTLLTEYRDPAADVFAPRQSPIPRPRPGAPLPVRRPL